MRKRMATPGQQSNSGSSLNLAYTSWMQPFEACITEISAQICQV